MSSNRALPAILVVLLLLAGGLAWLALSGGTSKTLRPLPGRGALEQTTDSGSADLSAAAREPEDLAASEPVAPEPVELGGQERRGVSRTRGERGDLPAAGRVTDSLGREVPGALVRAQQSGGERETLSDEEGVFQFTDLVAGPVTFSASAAGFLESTPLPMTLIEDEPLGDIPIVLRRGATLRVELDPTWLEPHANQATVVPLAAAGTGASRDVERAIEGRRRTQPFDAASAQAVFEDLMPGRWKVEVRPTGGSVLSSTPSSAGASLLLTETVELGEGEEFSVRLGVPPVNAVRVSGTVREGSVPLEGVRVVLAPRSVDAGRALSAHSSSDGRYELLVPEPGRYRLTATLKGDELLTRMMEVPAGTLHFDIALEGGRIGGRVETLQGAPVPFYPVRLASVRTPGRPTVRPRFARSDMEGRFEFRAVPEGSFRVTLGQRASKGGDTGSTSLTLTRGQVLGDVRLRLDANGSVSGEVRGGSGQAVGDAEVRLVPTGAIGTGETFRTTRTDGNGKFSFDLLPPGGFQVRAEKDGKRATFTVQVRAEGRHTAVLSLR